MLPIPPVKATLDIEINNSCNDCCGCLPWSKKKETPKGTKALEKQIIDKKINDYQKNFHESYHKPKHFSCYDEKKM